MEPGAEIHIWIREAEAVWLNALHAHAEEVFRNGVLPSHDQSHHMRVWNLCKSLIMEVSTFNSSMDPTLVEGTLIAAFFHDLGMAVSTREDHGRLSREACETWFRKSGRELPERREEILRAIEDHDRKSEQIYAAFRPETTPGILEFLSVADDLEALGTIGIYRYAEIYLLRGISLEMLGTKILDNAEIRFRKLEEACKRCPGLLKTYRKQYEELRDFYKGYNLQVSKTSHAERVNSGPLGVINYIRTKGVDRRVLKGAGKDIHDYFRTLEYELEQARV
jgi:HD superfamily phosphodiesterase